MRATLFLAPLALATAVRASQYTIVVGKDEVTGQPGIGFDPSRTLISGVDLQAANTILFQFLEGTHQVVQSMFGTPCAASGNFASGVINGTIDGSGPSSTFTVTNNTEILYFSDLGDNNAPCWQGAVFCVNTNETIPTQSCAAFKAAALALGTQHGVYANSTTSTLPIVPPATVVSHAPVSTMSTNASATAHAVNTLGAPSASASSTRKSSGVHCREGSVFAAFVGTVLGVVGALAF
ncbi:hypothetical protein JCM5296_000185 [Sporobolomyces johnsonii]